MKLINVEAKSINKKGEEKQLKVKHTKEIEDDLFYNVFSIFPPNELPTLENGEELLITYILIDE